VTTDDAAAAASLWSAARSGLMTAERAIVEIVKTGPTAWEPLGYASFLDAWKAEMAEVRLATAFLKATVVYEFFRHGMTEQEIVDSSPLGSGVGPESVARLREQYDAGVPASSATTTVRRHSRVLPSQAQVVKVNVGPHLYTAWRDIAEAVGSDLATEAEKALRAHFRKLDRVKVGA
jgi:hypothetical protein